MKRLTLWLALLGIALVVVFFTGAGCGKNNPTSPRSHIPDSTRCVISGVVRFSNGEPVNTAKVWLDSLATITTFSDANGRYTISKTTPADSLDLFARSGYAPGMFYVETCSGHARAPAAQPGGGQRIIHQDIVVDLCSPI
jgi:hypothetical protein